MLFRSVFDGMIYTRYKIKARCISEGIFKNNNLQYFNNFLRECNINYSLVNIRDINSDKIGVKLSNTKKPLSFLR